MGLGYVLYLCDVMTMSEQGEISAYGTFRAPGNLCILHDSCFMVTHTNRVKDINGLIFGTELDINVKVS